MLIRRRSYLTGKITEQNIDLTKDQLNNKSFNHLSDNDRYFMLTGVTNDEWTSLYGNNAVHIKSKIVGGFKTILGDKK